MSDEYDDRFRPYALKYFEIHASQRLIAFRFYIVLATAFGGGMLHFWGDCWRSEALGGVLSILSVLFWLLDKRTKDLVKVGEEALKFLDRKALAYSGEPHVLALIDRDDYLKGRSCLSFVSYRTCFAAMFLIGIIGGLIPVAARIL